MCCSVSLFNVMVFWKIPEFPSTRGQLVKSKSCLFGELGDNTVCVCMNLCVGVKMHSNVVFVYNMHAFSYKLVFLWLHPGKNPYTLYVLHISNMARIIEITAII